jgi:oxygen-dependent protoporphyrinogen oxidase
MPDVVVIGAGITGLTAAYDLARSGIRPVVLEKSDRSGGLLYTERVQECLIEAGADSMLAQKPAAVQLCEELGLASEFQGIRRPGAFVLRNGRLYPLPRPSILGLPTTWRGLAGYRLLSPAARIRLAGEPLVPAKRGPGDESVASFFRRRFGSSSVDLIAQPLLGGIHSGDIEQLSMRALFPRLLEAERTGGSVLRAVRGDRPVSRGSTGPATPFVALRNGMGSLVEALERRLPTGAISCRRAVDRVTHDARGWHVTSGPETFDARAIIFAAPASALASLFAPLDADVARICSDVGYVSTASIALAWPATAIARLLSGTGFVVARRESDVRITACTWVSSKWDGRAPEGTALLRAFVGGAHDPRAVDLDDDELIAVARGDLGRVLGIHADPTLARVYRWRNAGPQYAVGHADRMAALQDRLKRHRGFFVAGSGFHGVGIPDCISDARAVAAQAMSFVRDARS